jgi:hypothetical protein
MGEAVGTLGLIGLRQRPVGLGIAHGPRAAPGSQPSGTARSPINRFGTRIHLGGRFATLRPWFVSQVAIALFWLLWAPTALYQSQAYQDFWISRPTPGTVGLLVLDLTSAYLPYWHVPRSLELLVAVGVLLVGAACVRLPRPDYIFLLALLLIPVAAIFLVSQVKPIFLARALIYVSAPYLILIAAGITALRRWHLGTLILGVLVLANGISLAQMYTIDQKEQWDAAVQYLIARSTPGELVLFIAADNQIPFDYYAARAGSSLDERGLPADVLTVRPLEPVLHEADLPRLDELVAGRASFWIVESRTFFADPEGLVRRHADDWYRPVDEASFTGITVVHYTTSPVQELGTVY